MPEIALRQVWTGRAAHNAGRIILIERIENSAVSYRVLARARNAAHGQTHGRMSAASLHAGYRLAPEEEITTAGAPDEGRLIPYSRLDLTGCGGHEGQLRVTEVHTDAGIIRVATGIRQPLTGGPAAEVSISLNVRGTVRTISGGQWRFQVAAMTEGQITINLTRES